MSEQFKNAYFESFPGFITVRDTEGRLCYVNPTFEEWMRCFCDCELLGKTTADLAQYVPEYLQKPLHKSHELFAKYRGDHEAESEIIHYSDGEVTYYLKALQFMKEVDGKNYYFTTTFDVTPLSEAAKQFKKDSMTCPLTGLNNRRALEEYAKANSSGTVISIDLDRFKQVNDVHGHHAGDQVLSIFSDILKNHFRSSDFIARSGGDEFVVICSQSFPQAEFQRRLEAINSAFSERIRLDYPNVGWSAGVAEFSGSWQETLDNADKQMYICKRNCV